MWGGGCCDDASAAGAAFDPVRNTWQPLPASPLAGRRADGVWTGTELVIVGGQAHGLTFFADAAAYNPATRSWRRLPSLPAPRFGATLTWTGTQVLVVGGQPDDSAVPYADGWAYTPATNQWRQLPAMAVGRTGHVAVWTGHQLLVWGGKTRASKRAPYTTPSHGVVYDPATDQWSALPKAPIRGRVAATAVWTGSQLLIWGGRGIAEPFPQFTDGAAYWP
jgi:N-acetylneuraminic acid mutarotase